MPTPPLVVPIHSPPSLPRIALPSFRLSLFRASPSHPLDTLRSAHRPLFRASPRYPVSLSPCRPRFPRRPAIHSASPSPSLPSPVPSRTLVTLPVLPPHTPFSPPHYGLSLPHCLPLSLFPPSSASVPSILFPVSPYPLPCFPLSSNLLLYTLYLLPRIPFPASPHPPPCFPPSHPKIPCDVSDDR
ncbi:unnamed protein product [Closterium sp. NIES-64]|nr:unnamed protein product [Closterium sp. NIES-64]